MENTKRTYPQLLDEIQGLTDRLMEAEGNLHAILSGEVDGLMVSTADGDRVFTLSGAEHPYRIMVETMNEGAATLTSDGTILYGNRRFAEILKEPLETIVGSSIYPYISPPDLPFFKALINRGSKENSKGEVALQAGDLSLAPILLSASPLQHADMTDMVCIVMVDITELRTAYSEINRMKDALEAENVFFRREIKMKHQFEHIIGQSDGLKYVLYRAEQVAPMNTTVLILGETGTGKDLIAGAIHNMSPRRDRPLITVNCAALPPNLIEGELFGREKGAFTGADTRQMGRFEIANGSTLCLDEIGELPLELQAKLLRVIQYGEFERLGSSQTLKVDVRLVATTNRNLEEAISKGRFRQDLYYRLNVFPVTVPPLRLRKDDIPMLVQAFMERFSRKLGKEITSIKNETMKALQDYPWPGNVRELENIIERAVILCPGPFLQLADKLEVLSSPLLSAVRTLEETERNQIMKILSETQWRIEGKDGAAAILGIHPSTLRARMHKLGIERSET